jgi:hypothetical protein
MGRTRSASLDVDCVGDGGEDKDNDDDNDINGLRNLNDENDKCLLYFSTTSEPKSNPFTSPQ